MLNESQHEAVTHEKGPCLVLAGPGSGKTLTIVERITYLTGECQVPPQDILVITFTKYAANEMRKRFLSRANSAGVTFGTFHGIYYGILKWAYKLGPDHLMSEEQKYECLRSAVHQLEVDVADEREFYQDVLTEIGLVKNSLYDIAEYESIKCNTSDFRRIYRKYEELKRRAGKLDFEDMLVLCRNLFLKHPEILKQWQQKFRYILIDEFQDINQVQYEVIRMLAAPEDNLFVVGDDDQAIYGFRGARSELMFRFKEDYPMAKEIVLNTNYRSTENIIKNAGKVIANNQIRFSKEISGVKEPGCSVHVQEVRDPIEESEYVADEIEKREKHGTMPEKTAVLYRTKDEARTLAETLSARGISFQMKEHIPNIYNHFTAENMAAYFRLATGERTRRDFLAIMNRPKRYLSRECAEEDPVDFEKLRKFYFDKDWMQDRVDQLDVELRMIKRMTPYAAIRYIRRSIGYDDFLKEYAQFRHQSPEEYMERLQEIEDNAKPYKTFGEWFAHVEEYTRLLQIMESRKELKEQKGVHLMTIHSAKGLEFDAVHILGANEGLMPYKKAQLPEEIEEERRLFYVAMTRAKEELTVSYVKKKNGKDMSPSRFVNELLVTV